MAHSWKFLSLIFMMKEVSKAERQQLGQETKVTAGEVDVNILIPWCAFCGFFGCDDLCSCKLGVSFSLVYFLFLFVILIVETPSFIISQCTCNSLTALGSHANPRAAAAITKSYVAALPSWIMNAASSATAVLCRLCLMPVTLAYAPAAAAITATRTRQ